MPETAELIDFRRAFIWLLCGMLLPSVALVAFGVVSVANERAAVERRLAQDYDARLNALARDLSVRLDQAARSVLQDSPDPLVFSVRPLDRSEPALAEAQYRAAALPEGGHIFVSGESQGERRAWALVRTRGRTLVARSEERR